MLAAAAVRSFACHAPTRFKKLLPGADGGRPQARRGLTGIMNYTNPGAISHNEILELYKQYVDPEITWSNFSLEEQAKVIVAPRSNNLLDTARARARPRAQMAQPSDRMPSEQLAAGSWACSTKRSPSMPGPALPACLCWYPTSMSWGPFMNMGIASLHGRCAVR